MFILGHCNLLGLTMAASYCILMVRGEAEIGNLYDAQRSDGSSSVSRPRNIQTANLNGGSHQSFFSPGRAARNAAGNTMSGRVPLHSPEHPAALVRYTVIDSKTDLKGQRMAHTVQRLCIALIGLHLCILPVAAEDSLATILSHADGA